MALFTVCKIQSGKIYFFFRNSWQSFRLLNKIFEIVHHKTKGVSRVLLEMPAGILLAKNLRTFIHPFIHSFMHISWSYLMVIYTTLPQLNGVTSSDRIISE
jgi:hypothetical protein